MSGSKGPGHPASGGGKGAARGRSAGSRPPIRPIAGSSLYERYKDALRRGHVAALRNRNDAAIEAYQEAASIAPDRALPHASIGGILVKLNRPADAVASYERALALAPRDETALRGLAETLTRLGRRPAAADALDRLASTLDTAGRTADATDAARRALELAETPERRTRVEALAERLGTASPGDDAADRALSHALRVLDVPQPAVDVMPPDAAPAGEAAPSPERTEIVGEVGEVELVGEDAEAREAGEVGDTASSNVVAASETEGAADGTDELVADGAPDVAVDADAIVAEDAAEDVGARHATPAASADEEPPGHMPLRDEAADVSEPVGLGIALGAAAEGHLYAGELAEAHTGLLSAARAHRRAGRFVAAIDACYLAIGLAPADPDLHLLLAELYLDRGWRSQAAEKLVLLARLADLDADPATRQRLCAIVADRLPDEPRVADLCA